MPNSAHFCSTDRASTPIPSISDRDVPEVYIRIGHPGTGRSRWLDEQYGLDKWIEVPDNTGKWFDGCELADILVFNDVQLGAVPTLDVFRKLADRNTFRGAVKGGFTWLSPVSQFTLFQERRYSSSTKKCPKTRNSREKTVTLE